ncbi:MAG: hypothetical protein OHK0038_18170 [Flammeovirgaceae bacterium]
MQNWNFIALVCFFLIGCLPEKPRLANHIAFKTKNTIQIDGLANEADWKEAEWYPIQEVWLGDEIDSTDFTGRFKVLWDKEKLYLLAEIVDDTLIDIHSDGLKYYWDDDCLELFLDENHSGGKHFDNHNAFAYHIALDGKVVDIAKNGKPAYFNNHIKSAIKTIDKKTIWELEIVVHDKNYDEQNPSDKSKVLLSENKKMGFALAYCDNDYSKERENFIGSVPIEGTEKNLGYLTADVFGTLILKNKTP